MLHWSATTLQSHWEEGKKHRLAPQADSGPDLNSYSIVQPAQTQLSHCAADRSDAAWNYSVCPEAHLESGESSVQRYESATKITYCLSLCWGQYTEELRLKEGEGSKCISLPKLFLLFTCSVLQFFS